MDDLRGIIRLAVHGVAGVTHIAENLHANIVRIAPPLGFVPEQSAPGIAGFVYQSVRSSAALAGRGLEGVVAGLQALSPAAEPIGDHADSDARLAWLCALNGVVGDHLERTGNPLAIPMTLLSPERRGPDVLVLLHGLCMSERQWTRGGHDHGLALARTHGWTPVYVRYNSGLHVSRNGAELAARLQELVDGWPVPVRSIGILAHSMGGLVARSAAQQAREGGMDWPDRLRQMAFLGTPHHGAPLERGGNWLHTAMEISPYLAPFSRLGRIRSEGITDLRHGNLLEQDWKAGTYTHRDMRTVVPLPQGVECYAVAGAIGVSTDPLIGDGLVTVSSALGRHVRRSHHLRFPRSHTWVARGVHHLQLLESQAVYEKLAQWLRPG